MDAYLIFYLINSSKKLFNKGCVFNFEIARFVLQHSHELYNTYLFTKQFSIECRLFFPK